MKLTQEISIRDMMNHFGMSDAKGRDTPMETGKVIRSLPDEEMTNKPYRSLVGCLNYPVQWTRPDIAYAVGSLSQVLNHPTDEHWKIAMNVLQYLNKTKDFGLVLRGSNALDVKVTQYSTFNIWLCCICRRKSCKLEK